MFPSGLGFSLYQENRDPRSKPLFIIAQPRASYPEGRSWNKSVQRKALQLGEEIAVFSGWQAQGGWRWGLSQRPRLGLQHGQWPLSWLARAEVCLVW